MSRTGASATSLVARHGEPRLADGSPCGFSVISLGKLGGNELNYSSDIDLMFVYGGNGETDGQQPISNKEFYKKVANEYTALLSTYTAEGQCYRVDLRLRPDGTLGEICISDEGARRVLRGPGARLGKADAHQGARFGRRAGAGRRAAGIRGAADLPELARFPRRGGGLGNPPAHQRKDGRQSAACAGGLDVKLTPGGIRDIEFLVQCLQRLHGGREPWVRHGGTMLALFRLRDKGLLSAAEYARLARGLPVPALPGASPANGRGPADAHACRRIRNRLDLLARKMPADGTGANAQCRHPASSGWRNTWRPCARFTNA